MCGFDADTRDHRQGQRQVIDGAYHRCSAPPDDQVSLRGRRVNDQPAATGSPGIIWTPVQPSMEQPISDQRRLRTCVHSGSSGPSQERPPADNGLLDHRSLRFMPHASVADPSLDSAGRPCRPAGTRHATTLLCLRPQLFEIGPRIVSVVDPFTDSVRNDRGLLGSVTLSTTEFTFVACRRQPVRESIGIACGPQK